MATPSVTFIVKNKTKYPIDPVKSYPYYLLNATSFKGPEAIHTKEYGSGGNFRLEWLGGAYGILLAYVSPDTNSILVVSYLRDFFEDEEPNYQDVLKTVFLSSDTEITDKVYTDISNDEHLTESATYTYTDSDGKGQKLTVIATVDEPQQDNVHVDIKLRSHHKH